MLQALKALLDSMDIFWAVCGGDAIDLFVGKQTRPHKDIDIAAFWEDREKIITTFLQLGWRIFEPDHGLMREICSLDEDLRTEDNLWCIRPESSGYLITHHHDNFFEITTNRAHQDVLDYIEILFNREKNGEFLYKRNPSIRLSPYLYHSAEEIPFLAPEMVLLYKSVFVRLLAHPTAENMEVVENYRHDFRVAVEQFNDKQRAWLKSALEISYPMGHEWLEVLASSPVFSK